MTSKPRSRLAPSPTGALHLGNARTFLLNWALARQSGWDLIMRIEDLDGPRVRPGVSEGVLETLRWLGLDYDGDVLVQSTDLAPYRQALAELAQSGLVYACALSRREIEAAASAPNAGDHETPFPRSLRPPPAEITQTEPDMNYRFRTPDDTIVIDDAIAGRSEHTPSREIGDFIIWTKRDTPAYQLAVVVDDLRQGVTDVVRGDDLLPSAARQTMLYRGLNAAPPRYWHLPLVLGPDGRRLAKRHGDTRLDYYRDQGVAPERIVGLIASWCGAPGPRRSMTTHEFRDTVDLHRVPAHAITFNEDDNRWLLDP